MPRVRGGPEKNIKNNGKSKEIFQNNLYDIPYAADR